MPLEEKKHRLRMSGSGKKTRLYAYFGLKDIGDATLEPPRKVQHSQSDEMTHEQLQHQIIELKQQLRAETTTKLNKIKELEAQLATEKQARKQLEENLALAPFQWHKVGEILKHEIDALCQGGSALTDGPKTRKMLSEFSLSMLGGQFSKHSPHLLGIMSTLSSPGEDSAQAHPIHNIHSITAISILAKRKNHKIKGLQLLVSLMLIARAVHKKVITSLNHLGICLSYQQSMEWVKRLTKETKQNFKLKEGHWILVFDNVNCQKKIRHERMHRHTESWNFTSRLAVRINKLPPPDIEKKGDAPQGSRGNLHPELLLPNDEDEQLFRENAQHAVMKVLTAHFNCFHHLKSFVPDKRSNYQTGKSEIQPLALLDIDESLIDNNIHILLQFAKDMGLTGDTQQCVVGDQATCVTIRGAKRRRINDISTLEQLVWAKENPGEFHFLWECLRVIFILFWCDETESGSLSSLKVLLNHKKVDRDAKQFQQSDEL